MNQDRPVRTGRGVACGKAILLGEHAVVHGFPAVAVGFENGIEAVASAAKGPVALTVDEWNLCVSVSDDTPHGRAAAAMLEAAGLPLENARIVLHARIPPRAGLGASAAMATAVLRSLSDLFERPLSTEALFDAAQASEKIFHENPSGLDAAMAIHGGIARFSRSVGVSAIPSAPLKLRVVHSGAPKDTARSVARFAARMAASPAEAERRLVRIGEIVEAGIAAIAKGDTAMLGGLMVENHEHLGWFDVSTPALDHLVRTALDAGAVGAKLTGGGGGGCAVVLLSEHEESVVQALRREGFETVAV